MGSKVDVLYAHPPIIIDESFVEFMDEKTGNRT